MSTPERGRRSRAAICDTTLTGLVAARGCEPPPGAAALGADVLDASGRAWLRAAARALSMNPAPRPLEQPRS
jgi:hypothetical protein